MKNGVRRKRYVAAYWPRHGYVVYDRQQSRMADGFYLTLADAQWAADQRNRAEWKAIVNG